MVQNDCKIAIMAHKLSLQEAIIPVCNDLLYNKIYYLWLIQ